MTDVQNALRAQNIVNPAGQVGAEPAPPGQQLTFTVRAQGRLVEPEEFANVVVRENPDGSAVRVKDIARVELGSLNYAQYGTFNGKPAAVIAAFQTPGSNALEVAEQIKTSMRDLAKRFPPGIDYMVSLDTTTPVKAGIREIVETLLIAVALVVLVVFIFLQSWRATLIPLLTVPVSLIGAFIAFPLLGFSINTLSLFGLVLAIGLVVDDAIVVVEAVEHHIEEGMTPKEATLQAMREVSGPVVAIALVLAAVFIPVAFMGGVVGRLYQQFALTIAVSVLISAFNALTLSPALSAMLLRPRPAKRSLLGRLGDGFNTWFGRATDGYVTASRVLVRKLFIPLVLLVGVSVAAWGLGRKIPSGFVPDEDQGYIVMGVQLPDGASLQRTMAVYRQMDAIIASEPGIATYNGIAGFSFFTRTAASYTGTGFAGPKPWEERATPALSSTAIIGRLNAAFSRIPEARIIVVAPPAIPGISATGGFSMMLQDRSGGSYEFLAQNVQKFVAEARKRPGAPSRTCARRTSLPAVPQLFAEVDKDKALAEGVSITEIYNALQTFLGGSYVNDFTRFGRQWRVFLQADSQFRTGPEDIGQFYVRNNRGEMVPLFVAFVRVKRNERAGIHGGAVQPVPVGRDSRQPGSRLQLRTGPSTLFEEVATKTLPPEMGYAWNGLSYQEKVASGGSAQVLGLSLVFVFLIPGSGPLRELVAAVQRSPERTPVAVLGAYVGLSLAALRQQRVCPDRARHARGAHREERDPHR